MLKYLFVLLKGSERKTLSDEELVTEYLKTQNNYFFELLYNRYSHKVYGKCVTILKDQSLAQDATQDIMMKVLLNLSKFGGRSKFSTWLYSITYNFCIDYVRKEKKNKSILVDDIGKYEGIAEEVNDQVILEVKLENLKLIMQKIPVQDKSVLMMKYLDGMSIKEIGISINKSESAVKMKLKRAKHKFMRIHHEHLSGSLHF